MCISLSEVLSYVTGKWQKVDTVCNNWLPAERVHVTVLSVESRQAAESIEQTQSLTAVLAGSVLPRNFITGDNVPGHLKMWGHLRKKRGHCVKNDGTVIWR